MLKFFNANQKDFKKKLELILNVRNLKQRNQSTSVKKILTDVKRQGDKAVIKYEKKFSRVSSKGKKIKFSKNEINKIIKNLSKDLKKSIDIAYSRIKKFHLKQKYSSFKFRDEYKNELSYNYSPIEKVGV